MRYLPCLRSVRESRLLTATELARQIGVTKATLSRLENGVTRARLPTIRSLATALDVPPAALWSCKTGRAW